MEYVSEDMYANGEGVYTVRHGMGEASYILVEPPYYDEMSVDGEPRMPVFCGRAIRIGKPIYMEDEEEEAGSTKAYLLIWKIIHKGEVEAYNACDMAHPISAIPLGGENYFFNIYTEEFYEKGGVSLELH